MVQVFWLPLLTAPLCLAAAVAGVRFFLHRNGQPPRAVSPGPPPLAALAPGELEVTAEVRVVLERLAPLAKRQLVTLTTGIQRGLTARADAAAFRRIVSDLVENALRRAPCGTVLVTAGRFGGRVQVSIGDDGKAGTLPIPEATLSGIARLVGLQGGTLDFEARPGDGTIATIRLPAGQRVQRDEAPAIVAAPSVASRSDAPAA
jgi:hypothetical protein